MSKKIQKLLTMLLIKVNDIHSFKNDFNSIIEMFNQVSKSNLSYADEITLQKKISYKMLRDDKPIVSKLLKNQKGKYFIVPKVIRKI